MPPHALRHVSPASEETEVGGRHRRSIPLDDILPARQSISVPVPRGGGGRHHRAAFLDDTPSGPISTVGGRRRAPAHRGTGSTPTGRRPVTGSHRAPGTLPIESWLLMGKKRQQVLLASLVAVGVLLVALPGQHAQDKVDAVKAAQQREAEIRNAASSSKKNGGGGQNKGGNETGGDRDSVTTAPTVAPSAGATSAAPTRPGTRPGPGRSLRTTGSSTVALTFDDGPDPVQTPKILALLEKYDVKATFCLVGENVEKYPDVVRQIVMAGHTLCNHTWNHSLTIGKDDPEDIRADLARTSAAIQAAVPSVSVPFFRAPGGNFTDRLVSVAGETGMTSLYWAVDPRDWDHPEGETDAAHVKRVVAEVKKSVRPGSIVLSHDFNQPDTIAAYEELLPWLADHFKLGIPRSATPGAAPAVPSPSASATPEPTESAEPPAGNEPYSAPSAG